MARLALGGLLGRGPRSPSAQPGALHPRGGGALRRCGGGGGGGRGRPRWPRPVGYGHGFSDAGHGLQPVPGKGVGGTDGVDGQAGVRLGRQPHLVERERHRKRETQRPGKTESMQLHEHMSAC